MTSFIEILLAKLFWSFLELQSSLSSSFILLRGVNYDFPILLIFPSFYDFLLDAIELISNSWSLLVLEIDSPNTSENSDNFSLFFFCRFLFKSWRIFSLASSIFICFWSFYIYRIYWLRTSRLIVYSSFFYSIYSYPLSSISPYNSTFPSSFTYSTIIWFLSWFSSVFSV